jgi:hypothetical protein
MRDYLRGPLKAKFDMEVFCEGQERCSTECGSVGCVIGQATYAIEPKMPSEDYIEYSERVFGLSRWTPGWEWCFSGHWAGDREEKQPPVDNTPEGAADRINYYLEYGLPKNWQAIIRGDEPICY